MIILFKQLQLQINIVNTNNLYIVVGFQVFLSNTNQDKILHMHLLKFTKKKIFW